MTSSELQFKDRRVASCSSEKDVNILNVALSFKEEEEEEEYILP